MTEKEHKQNIFNWTSFKDTFYFSHFSKFYRLYIPAAIIIGIICGLMMVIFQLMINASILLFSHIPIFIAPLIGGLFSASLIYIGRTEIAGSGISKAIELTHKPEDIKNSTTMTKMIATAVSIGTGNPVGREGPAVLIGAAVGNSVARRMGHRSPSFLRVFLMMGSAAATAGIYKAPLGGALFAAEAPYRRDARLGYFVPIVISSITSYLVFILFMGVSPHFTFHVTFDITLHAIPLLLIFGFLCGIVSVFFAAVFTFARRYFVLRLKDWMDPIAGSTIACILIFVTGLVLYPGLSIAGLGFDVGPDVIDYVAVAQLPLYILVVLLLGKLFASSFVVGGKVSGGVLASSLFVGAMLGRIFGDLFYPELAAAFVVLGMGAVLAANTNTPVATTILLLEMSHTFDIVIPLVICVCVSYLVSGGSSLYEGQRICRDDEFHDFFPTVNDLKSYGIKSSEFLKDSKDFDQFGATADENSS